MCKAAAPNNSTPSQTSSNNYSTPRFTDQIRASHESASKFCGRCGRPLEYGQSSCRYCEGTVERNKTLSTTTTKSNAAIVIASVAVCLAAILLLPTLFSGNQQTQFTKIPQTVQEPQFEQNSPTPEQKEAQAVKSLTSLCDAILLDDNIRFLGLSFSEVEQTLGRVSQVLFDANGANRIIFEHSQDHRFDFGELIVPTEYWYT